MSADIFDLRLFLENERQLLFLFVVIAILKLILYVIED
jgi:hypothetical protein